MVQKKKKKKREWVKKTFSFISQWTTWGMSCKISAAATNFSLRLEHTDRHSCWIMWQHLEHAVIREFPLSTHPSSRVESGKCFYLRLRTSQRNTLYFFYYFWWQKLYQFDCVWHLRLFWYRFELCVTKTSRMIHEECLNVVIVLLPSFTTMTSGVR